MCSDSGHGATESVKRVLTVMCLFESCWTRYRDEVALGQVVGLGAVQ